MRKLWNAMLLVALIIPAGLEAQTRDPAPACRGSLDGNRLTTTIEFADGYAVEAPWRVSWTRGAAFEDGTSGMVANAVLDRIIESNSRNGERIETSFPEPIETTFEGATEEELVYRAAQVWCLTVLKAQERTNGGRGASDRQSPARTPSRTVG